MASNVRSGDTVTDIEVPSWTGTSIAPAAPFPDRLESRSSTLPRRSPQATAEKRTTPAIVKPQGRLLLRNDPAGHVLLSEPLDGAGNRICAHFKS